MIVDDLDHLKREVARIKWYHQIDLRNGIVTPGIDNSMRKLRRLHLPECLEGKTILDIGAWNGFFSFEAERRGAKRVLATDHFCWNGEGWGTKEGFELARRVLDSRVEDLEIDVLDLSPDRVGTFDIVLFLGVLYHMRHPLLALEKVASVTKECAIIETVSDFVWCRRPVIPFYLNDELNRDPTNWCAPNPPGVVALLMAAGFKEVKIMAGVRSFPFRLAKAIYYRLKYRAPFYDHIRTDRIAVHAWK
jgi:tRNA (mo5U34)-methyltransferase